MIFTNVQLNDKDFDVDGQYRVTEDKEIKVSFNSLKFGNALKQYHETRKVIVALVFKHEDEEKNKFEQLILENLTIDNNGYRATFIEQ